MQVLEKVASKIPEIEAVIDRVRDDLKKQTRNQKAIDDARAFLAALKDSGEMKSVSETFNVELKSTDFFKRNASIPGIGYETKINEAAFELSSEKKLPENVIEGRQGHYVIQYKETKAPDPSGFEAEKEKIKQNLLEQKKIRVFNAFLKKVKSNSEITRNKEFLE